MIDSVLAGGVRRVVKLSAIGTGERDERNRTVGAWQQAAEQAVRASGMAWTLLRPSVFASNSASNFLWWAESIKVGEPVPNMTGAGRQGVVDPRDVAAVAVEALTSPAHADLVYTLTGPELLGVPDQAARLGELLGHPVETVAQR